MNELTYAYMTGALITGNLVLQVLRRRFDPFDPIWLFSIGYFQLYVVQAVSYHDYAIRVRGEEVTADANYRAFWAMAWMLAVYYSGIGGWIARRLPNAPTTWSKPLVVAIAPILLLWGLLCARYTVAADTGEIERGLLLNFPILMLAAGVMLIVTARANPEQRIHWPLMIAGLAVTMLYAAIWVFNGKRSHSLFGVLATLAAFYIVKGRRPSYLTLAVTAVVGALVVAMSLGWRNNPNYTRDLNGFVKFVQEFDARSVLVSLNLKEREETENSLDPTKTSKETEEYGGFLLMMWTVPHLSEYDYGVNYLRVFSTYIPRVVWPTKPLFGRDQWVNAWIAGSEFKRDNTFTGPAIGLLGAAQLNGGAVGTLIVIAALALLLRVWFDYFLLHARTPWAQAWWPLTFYNAWLMTVNDDPMIWQYYVYGHTILPVMAFFWIFNKLNP